MVQIRKLDHYTLDYLNGSYCIKVKGQVSMSGLLIVRKAWRTLHRYAHTIFGVILNEPHTDDVNGEIFLFFS